MTFTQRIKWIQSNIVIATEKRKRIQSSIPRLKAGIKVLDAALDGLEKEVALLYEAYGYDSEWCHLIAALEDDEFEAGEALSDAQMALERAEGDLQAIEQGVEGASYDMADAANP